MIAIQSGAQPSRQAQRPQTGNPPTSTCTPGRILNVANENRSSDQKMLSAFQKIRRLNGQVTEKNFMKIGKNYHALAKFLEHANLVGKQSSLM